MKIIHCKLNHLTNPLGWDVAHPTVSWVATEARGCFQQAARVWLSLSEDFADCLMILNFYIILMNLPPLIQK